MAEQIEKYRFDDACGKLYEYDEDQRAYVFVSSTESKTKAEAIQEYEDEPMTLAAEGAHEDWLHPSEL